MIGFLVLREPDIFSQYANHPDILRAGNAPLGPCHSFQRMQRGGADWSKLKPLEVQRLWV